MSQATEFISYRNWHLVINSISNFSLIVKLLVEDAIFEYYLGQEINGKEFIDLYICRSRVIAARWLLDI